MRAAIDIAASIRGGASAAALIEATLARIARTHPSLNCFTHVTAERARHSAACIDARVAAGEDPGPLAGVPFAVKNLFDVAGEVTLAGSILLRTRPPAVRDAFAIRQLEAAGAILVGMLNMDEFAYGFATENAHYGATRNPHDPTRIAGGSSGGSAAAVAAGLVPLTLGSDTNGSIRVPAALCGVYGLKPTYGRLGRSGSVPFVHSLDHVGPFARNVADLALAYELLQGPDAEDPACIRQVATSTTATDLGGLMKSATPLRCAMLDGWFQQHASAAALHALQRVALALDAHATATLPLASAARSAAFCLTAAEGGSLHLPALRTQPDQFDPATRDRLIAGALQPAHVLVRAQRVRRVFLQQCLALFEHFDVLLAPSTPFAATPIGQSHTQLGDSSVSVRANLGLYTQPLSFVGLPVLSVPVCIPGELPLGVQLIAPPWQEERLLRLAAQLEQSGVIGASEPRD
ncbi:MAG: AtzE family amidohydrolase [Steroidobacteraceae bacterium]